MWIFVFPAPFEDAVVSPTYAVGTSMRIQKPAGV